MTTTIGGSYPAVNSDSDATINGLTVGKGGGAVSTATAVGYQALNATNTGAGTTGFGYQALLANTSGANNTAVGSVALYQNTTGASNIGVGAATLATNTTGSYNVAVGTSVLTSNTTASYNTAVGYVAGQYNTTGRITAVGAYALQNNTSGASNTAVGGYDGTTDGALYLNTTGSANTAMGVGALRSNTTASYNTAVGYKAAYSVTTGAGITAIGDEAGYSITTGAANTLIGQGAGYSLTTGYRNTFVGCSNQVSGAAGGLMTTGTNNTIIGAYTGNQGGLDIRTASNYIVLSDGDGNPRAFWNNVGAFSFQANGATAQNSTNFSSVSNAFADWTFKCDNAASGGYGIGSYLNNDNGTNFYFGGYSTSSNAYRIKIYSNGNIQNTNNSYGSLSDIKLKENIIDATPKLDDLMKIKIRQYNLKDDKTKRKQIGVIAQELEEVFPNMVDETTDLDGDNNDLGTTTKAVKYSVFVPMLIKAIQELKAEFDAYKATHP